MPSISIGVLLTLLEASIYISNSKAYREIVLLIMTYITVGSISCLFIIQCNYYTYLSINLYKKHQINVANLFSYSENIDLKWIRVLLTGFIIFIISMVLVNLMDGLLSDILFDVLMTLYIIYIGINALNQKEIYQNNPIKINDENGSKSISTINEINEEDNVKNALVIEENQPELFLQLKTALLKKIIEEKVFRDQDLSIYKLSKELNTNSKYLSTIINKEFKKNFVNFINEFRIEEAKINLKSDQFKNYTIEAHGQHVGFKSKSSFNIAFKKFTGKTPSEFLKN
jgi:AraC-like DNA-binding protein